MTGRPSDERLSAWLDNELAVEERAEFEKELEANPELRQELEERYPELSRGELQKKTAAQWRAMSPGSRSMHPVSTSNFRADFQRDIGRFLSGFLRGFFYDCLCSEDTRWSS